MKNNLGTQTLRDQKSTPQIRFLRRLSGNTKTTLIHRKPLLETDHCRALSYITEQTCDYFYADVPLRNIVGLGHHNFFETGRSWANLLYPHGEKEGLTCKGWGWSAFNFFRGHWGDTSFAKYADYCNMPLRLSAFGGAVFVTNGMHRIAGAYIYLAWRLGDRAVLKQAWICSQKLKRGLLPVIKDKLCSQDCQFFVHESGTLALVGQIMTTLAKPSDGGITVHQISSLHFQLKQRNENWCKLDRDLLSAVADGDWLQSPPLTPAPPYIG